MTICAKDHRYSPEYLSLPDAQDNRSGGRHICAACAFEAGKCDGLNGVPPKTDLSYLPYSQAGTVRHKDAKKAYDAGYSLGKKKGFIGKKDSLLRHIDEGPGPSAK